ncbi:hypothetical protein [Thiocystis violascens]|uniref:Outer membrane protein beta-barrel domain-containing protein n=1 Tax=Thiocystis violascens (strain ATCC 17096 / DSM 198 / 6111) TaxID=765911 RepID=I3Y8S9_THIV6|nr:hypothetical protein [Thiocystis violascens]AFL73397.1 hypothetical protein Thivi_1389 [Thiocystis violascens DSM 198]
MKAAVVCLAMVVAGPTAAQNSGWSFTLSPYAWVPGIASSVETAWGRLDVDKSGGDVLSKLDLAFMGAFEARRGRWGLIADLFYADLSQRRDTPLGVLFSQARIAAEAKALSVYAAYRMHEDNQLAVDLLAGLRVNSLDLDVSLSPGRLSGQRFGVGETWVDPLFGGRARLALADRWFATAFADIGGFDRGADLTWQVFASLGYQFNERWSAQGGWRHVAFEKTLDGRTVELDFSGPLFGVTARF